MRALAIAAAAIGLALASRAAAADAERVYAGSAGPMRIVMALNEDGGEVYGRYFYARTRTDIDISGKRAAGGIDLASEETGDRIRLVPAGADLTGVLTTAKGRSFPVRLSPAAQPGDLPPDAPKDLDLYGRLQIGGLAFVPDAVERRAGRTIRWFREPVTGLRLFRLEGGYPPAASAAINHRLAEQQWTYVSHTLGCAGSDGRTGVETSRVDALWLGARYLSYRWMSSWDCAHAAHPDFGPEGHAFDARSGGELSLDAVLTFGGPPAPKTDSDAWMTYRDRVFAPRVVALLKRTHPTEMRPPHGDDDCDYTDPEVWTFPAWTLSDRGLWLGAYFPRVARACDAPDWAIAPWNALAIVDRP